MHSYSILDKSVNIRFSEDIFSGDEYDYTHVKHGGHYSFDVSNKKAMFVLPPNPFQNFTVNFVDKRNSLLYNHVIIHRNGNLIMGEKENMNCDVPGISFVMKYLGGYIGWMVEASI